MNTNNSKQTFEEIRNKQYEHIICIRDKYRNKIAHIDDQIANLYEMMENNESFNLDTSHIISQINILVEQKSKIIVHYYNLYRKFYNIFIVPKN